MAGGSARRILVVEDERHIARFLEYVLRKEGYAVETVFDGAAAEDKVRGSSFHAILLDLGLPDQDGISTLRQLRDWSAVPVIVLTVQDDEDNDGIPTHGSFSGQYQPRTSSRLNFYDDDQPTIYDPDQNTATGLMGDVSGDGRVTMHDAALVLKYTAGGPLTTTQQAQADINSDTTVDAADALAIAKKALGLN